MSKVSIIIPGYNAERTIRRCLNSVLGQTYRDLEVIFINDGSTDDTLSIVQEYGRVDSRIRILDREENKGVSAARNYGITHACGEYIQFMDADDEMLPTMVGTLLEALQDNDADIAVSNFTGNPMFFTRFKDRVYDLSIESDVLEYYQDTFCMLLPWNKLYRREILTNCFDEEVHFAEDELYNLSVLNAVKKIVCVNQPLYIYHYAPADDVNMEEIEEKSCLNKIIEETDHNSRNSIWYMGDELVPRRRKILEQLLANKLITNIDDYLYTRVFDFYFWELSAFAFMKVEKEVIVRETIQVFQERDFIKSMQVQEKFGIQYICYHGDKLESLVTQFVELSLECYADIEMNQLDVNFYEVFLLLFKNMFCSECSRKIDRYNKLYQLGLELTEDSTAVANYVNALIENEDRLVCKDVV